MFLVTKAFSLLHTIVVLVVQIIMAWVIVLFSDQTVSCVPEKWLRNKGRKCYFPKKKILIKIKLEAEVDKKSEKWCLHACRILMGGRKNLRFH